MYKISLKGGAEVIQSPWCTSQKCGFLVSTPSQNGIAQFSLEPKRRENNQEERTETHWQREESKPRGKETERVSKDSERESSRRQGKRRESLGEGQRG